MKKADTTFWDQHRNMIRSRKGGWIIGKGIYTHGYSLIDELVGKVSYFQILVLNITGKLPDKTLASWLEAAYSCMSFPDSRIWCNQIGTLAGDTMASPFAGITAGVLAADSKMYGPGTVKDVFAFLELAHNEYNKGASVEEIVLTRSRRKGSKPSIPGYGRPIATGDERVMVMEKVTANLGFEKGETLSLAYKIEDYMLENYDESMNLATFTVSFLRDNGLSSIQIQQCLSFMVAAGVAACFDEATENPPESFLPLRCNDIDYQGKGPRSVPEK